MAKLKLTANPTFKSKVPVPVAGGGEVSVEMTFKHRTRSEFEEWLATREGKSDTESFLEIVAAWELEDELNPENVKMLLENYMGAALATLRTYSSELIGSKVKNSAPSL